MAKFQSEKERKLQKKLIPLNIFVCILCLVATFSLIFTPIIKVDIGKILHNDSTMAFVDEKIDEMLSGSMGDSSDLNIDFKPVISSVVTTVLNSAEGSISISGYNASKVAFASGDEKANQVMNELFFGDNALVTKLIDSIVNGILELVHPSSGTSPLYETIEETIINNMASMVVEQLPESIAEKISDEDLQVITEAIKGINDIKDGDVSGVVDEITSEIEKITGSEIAADDKVSINDEMQKLYDETAAELGENENVTIESLICVAVSKNVDLGEINLDNIFGSIVGGGDEDNSQPTGSVRSYRTADEEITEGAIEGGEPDNDVGTTEDGIEGPDGADEGEIGDPSVTPDENKPETPEAPSAPETSDRKIVTTYSDLMVEIGLDESKLTELGNNLRSTLEKQVGEMTADYAEYMGYYGYVFYVMLGFSAPWLILFLFSFFHMLTKNKRFMMWYVKLFFLVPAIMFIALGLLPKLFPKLLTVIPELSEVMNGEQGPLIQALLTGVSSLVWISGLCYFLLWLVSIFWAFPIKHKIRKERKTIKKYGEAYAYNAAPSSDVGTGTDYGSGSLYGSAYDDDDDGFNSPYLGSSYGSDTDYGYGSLFDDDDDDDLF